MALALLDVNGVVANLGQHLLCDATHQDHDTLSLAQHLLGGVHISYTVGFASS